MEARYEHVAQYYETDQMGVIHHSNFIRWMEEARIDFMSQMGFSYDKMEKMNIISPVLDINCRYKSMVRFYDTVVISTRLKEYNGIKLVISYEMKNKLTDEICAVGESRHCFLDKDRKMISLSRKYPEIDRLFRESMGI